MELGRIGIWSGQIWNNRDEAKDAAAELERLGYGALWFPNRRESFELARDLLDATGKMIVATGIASIFTHTAKETAAAHHALTQAHPNRFLLGLGVSHEVIVDSMEPGRYAHPVERMREYLDALDAVPTPVPVAERALAALGPRMLELARDRAAGTHPYLATPEHTRRAREAVGPDRLVAPEQAVVLEADPARARAIARTHLSLYLTLPNYTNNWLRLGFTADDLADGGSDRLVDALVAWGSVDQIGERIAAHRRAGADHVCLQVLTADPTSLPRAEWRALTSLLSSSKH
jgi:probable F420-dependent oxidoreductase